MCKKSFVLDLEAGFPKLAKLLNFLVSYFSTIFNYLLDIDTHRNSSEINFVVLLCGFVGSPDTLLIRICFITSGLLFANCMVIE